MTTKKRLAALELASEKARAARIEARQAQVNRAHARLTREEVQILQELANASQEELAAVQEAAHPYTLVSEADQPFLAWAEHVDGQPDDEPLTPAPAGAVAQFQHWGARCREALNAPECVGPLRTAYRWHVGIWAWDAALASEAGEVSA